MLGSLQLWGTSVQRPLGCSMWDLRQVPPRKALVRAKRHQTRNDQEGRASQGQATHSREAGESLYCGAVGSTGRWAQACRKRLKAL